MCAAWTTKLRCRQPSTLPAKATPTSQPSLQRDAKQVDSKYSLPTIKNSHYRARATLVRARHAERKNGAPTFALRMTPHHYVDIPTTDSASRPQPISTQRLHSSTSEAAYSPNPAKNFDLLEAYVSRHGVHSANLKLDTAHVTMLQNIPYASTIPIILGTFYPVIRFVKTKRRASRILARHRPLSRA